MKKANVIAIVLALLLIMFTSCGQISSSYGNNSEQQYQQQYDLGLRFLSEGNYEEAIIAFEAAIAINPKAAQAYVQLSNIYIELKQYDDAKQIIENGLSEIENNNVLNDKLDEIEYEMQQPENVGESTQQSGEFNNGGDNVPTSDVTNSLNNSENTTSNNEAGQNQSNINVRDTYINFINSYSSNYDIISYQFADIDDNGVEEMILQLEYWDLAQPPPLEKSELYTMVNGDIVLVEETNAPRFNASILRVYIENDTQKLVLVNDYIVNSWDNYGSNINILSYNATSTQLLQSYSEIHTMEKTHGDAYYESDSHDYLYYLHNSQAITKDEYTRGVNNLNISVYNDDFFFK